MKLVVTDTGLCWNHKHPALKQYAKDVIVICINGEKVTDKYKCIVSPYKFENHLGLADVSILSDRFKKLQDIKDDILECIDEEEDCLFLTDQEPDSLFPYLLVKDEEYSYCRMHLWTMSPLILFPKRKKNAFYEALYDLRKPSSLLLFNTDAYLDEMCAAFGRSLMITDFFDSCSNKMGELLPKVIFEIENNLKEKEQAFFDFSTNRYIEIHDSYDQILQASGFKREEDFIVPELIDDTMGFLRAVEYPDNDATTKDLVEQLYPRINGTKICRKLKEMRIALAKANGLFYEPVNCPADGPCAGTCPKCDEEICNLLAQIAHIPEEKRIYPFFEITPEKFFKGSGSPDSRIVAKDYYNRDMLPGLPIFLREVKNDE